MMDKKENYILNNGVFDFEIFPIEEAQKLIKDLRGSNLQKLTIVYLTESDPKEDLAFLKKILGAVHLDFENDIQLLGRTNEQKFSFSGVREYTEIEKLMVFGKPPADLGLHFSIALYQPFEFAGCTFLFADSLDQVAKDKAKKGALWAALQSIFSVE